MLPNILLRLKDSMELTGKIGPTVSEAPSNSHTYLELLRTKRNAPNQLHLLHPQRLKHVLSMIGIDEMMKDWDSYNSPSNPLHPS